MTWLLVYEKQKDAEKGKKLVQFLDWMMRDGQKTRRRSTTRRCPSRSSRRRNKRSGGSPAPTESHC